MDDNEGHDEEAGLLTLWVTPAARFPRVIRHRQGRVPVLPEQPGGGLGARTGFIVLFFFWVVWTELCKYRAGEKRKWKADEPERKNEAEYEEAGKGAEPPLFIIRPAKDDGSQATINNIGATETNRRPLGTEINQFDAAGNESNQPPGRGAMAGIVIGAIAILGIIVFGILIYHRKRTSAEIQIVELPPLSPAIKGGSNGISADLAGAGILELSPAVDGRIWMSNELSSAEPITEMPIPTRKSEENLPMLEGRTS
ncbi:hypothetical protein DFH27DRAFT_631043 [Peziza echinospora]|nr:hypothetical protein DFH27DRAFT_631043 [Peziza echinospora]